MQTVCETPRETSVADSRAAAADDPRSAIRISLLTGGGDRPYALGIVAALIDQGVDVDFIGSDDLDCPLVRDERRVRFLNLRGAQNPDASAIAKAGRVLRYYLRLLAYAAGAKPTIFHLLWNNKFLVFDRTLLMLYYRALGKRVVFTAHNVNAAKRDARDSWMNRASLWLQYRLSSHIFVHTEAMKRELVTDFGVPHARISVIPFGINNSIPVRGLTRQQSRGQLGIAADEPTLLFFGHVAPYKGLEYLLAAMTQLHHAGVRLRLIVAGPIKPGCADYWNSIRKMIADGPLKDSVTLRIEYVPDEEVECFFKAADVAVLPYTDVSQSGVAFLAYNFGLPLIATDVGSLREDVVEGETGFICRPRDAGDLAVALRRYLESDLYRDLEERREHIRRFALEHHSWTKVGEVTRAIYDELSPAAVVRE